MIICFLRNILDGITVLSDDDVDLNINHQIHESLLHDMVTIKLYSNFVLKYS